MMKQGYSGPLERIDPCCVRIPKSYKPGMRVPGMIFVNDNLLEQCKKDQAPDQVANVAFLPGIVGASIAMPDIHWGYGFSIGGVAATEVEEAFEMPLAHLLEPRNHLPRTRWFDGYEVEFTDLAFESRIIWGATAGMLLTFYRMLGASRP